ncbi:MAG: 5-demethoxyubiquinol-8 5-hydroxylase UbiM, partial [Proteobacteria bacterium]|nr:5-demethoxyubiquinol-8 5-hydroxylase UbiM [Pseudomonadota bacterium]
MHYDIIIVGAGPAGLAFARSLRDSDLKVLIVEKQAQAQIEKPEYDGRDLALTHLSRKTMLELGVWQLIPEQSISFVREAKVLDGESLLSLDFDPPEDEGLPLGYMISNHHIRQACYRAVKDLENVMILYGQTVSDVSATDSRASVILEEGERYTANLVVAADSRFSETRRKMGISADMFDFAHSAIVCRVEHTKEHNNTAWEIFQYGRTLAILPQHDRQSSVVITVPGNQVDEILSLSPEAFASDLGNRFNHRLGEMKLVSERHHYPLVAVHAKRFYAQRFCTIGDAAVGMHPVTAHGWNLGLRSQATLSQLVLRAHERGRDIATVDILRRYETLH